MAWYSHNCRQQVSGLSVASKRYLTVTSTSLAEPLDSCQRPCSIAIFKLLGYATRILSYSDDYAARSEWASESFLIIARPRKAEFRQVLGKALFFSPKCLFLVVTSEKPPTAGDYLRGDIVWYLLVPRFTQTCFFRFGHCQIATKGIQCI